MDFLGALSNISKILSVLNPIQSRHFACFSIILFSAFGGNVINRH